MAKAQTFGFMVEQQSTSMNFQHGDSYLSPSKSTAIRYAVNKKYGSELLTYASEFLDELIRRKVPGVSDDLYRRFPHIYRFLNISCAPVLVEVHHASPIDLVDERGGDALHNLREIEKLLAERGEMDEVLLQQTNFRLRRAVPPSELTLLMELEGAEQVLAPAAVPRPEGDDWVGAGSGWDAYAAPLGKQLGSCLERWVPAQFPHARDMLPLAVGALHAGRALSAEQALPLYIRDDVAAKANPRG